MAGTEGSQNSAVSVIRLRTGQEADLRAGPVMLPLSMDHSRVWEVIDVGDASEREGRGFVA